MDGAHTHGPGRRGLGELVLLAFGIVVAADVLARVLTLLLIVLTITGGVLVLGLISYAVATCRRYQQASALEEARSWPMVPEDAPRAVNADPVTLRQAITELQAQLLASRAAPPGASHHEHLHFHGLTPEQAAAIIAQLRARQHPNRWQDGGSQ